MTSIRARNLWPGAAMMVKLLFASMLTHAVVLQHRWLVQETPGMPALPKMVLDRYENQPKFCFFNMLPEIGRCWASIDNCLFLWRLGEKCALHTMYIAMVVQTCMPSQQ